MSLFITEFTQEGIDQNGRIMPCAKQMPIAEQVVSVSGSSAQSSSLKPQTTLVRLNATVNCHVLFGADPTATTSNMRLCANQTEYFAVQDGLTLKIAVIEE